MLLLSFNLFANIGRFIYRTDDPIIGYGHNFTASLNLKPTPKFNIELAYDRARLSDEDTNRLFYDGNIYRTVSLDYLK